MLGDAHIKIVIVSLTNGSHKVRAAEFNRVCKRLGAEALMLDYPDGSMNALPDFGDEVEKLLRGRFLGLSDLTCVVTHAPHGNEKPHPQHIQAFNRVKKWCETKNIPWGFFSEKLVPNLKVSKTGEKVNCLASLHTISIPARAVMNDTNDSDQIAKSNLRAYLRLMKRGFGLLHSLRLVRNVLIVNIDISRKQSLMKEYASQFEGLKQYKTYLNAQEYLYLTGRQAPGELAAQLKCLSS
jgi:LmbE family N-acetylglucosaminyl deacetylase